MTKPTNMPVDSIITLLRECIFYYLRGGL